jgi:dTDP-4-dehydrorhamnose reductase
MIWLIGNKGMLGSEIARQLSENKIDFVGTDIDVDITSYDALATFYVVYENRSFHYWWRICYVANYRSRSSY